MNQPKTTESIPQFYGFEWSPEQRGVVLHHSILVLCIRVRNLVEWLRSASGFKYNYSKRKRVVQLRPRRDGSAGYQKEVCMKNDHDFIFQTWRVPLYILLIPAPRTAPHLNAFCSPRWLSLSLGWELKSFSPSMNYRFLAKVYVLASPTVKMLVIRYAPWMSL